MKDLLQGQGSRALYAYKILPLLSIVVLCFVSTQPVRFVFIGFLLLACLVFLLLYPVKAYIDGDKLFYKRTFGGERSIELSSIKELTPQYRARFGRSYTVLVKYGNNKKLEILGLSEKSRTFMRNVNQLPPFYILEEIKHAIRAQQQAK